MTHRAWVVACFIAMVVVGCAKMEDRAAGPGAVPAPEPQVVAAQIAGQPQAPGVPALGQRAMRITVDTTLVVGDLNAAFKKLRALVDEHGGYLSDAKIQGSENWRSGSMEARIPTAKLPSFRAAVALLGEVASDAEKAEDVTEQRADIGARLRNARAQEKRLLDLLSDKTGSLSDVLAVEKELAEIRETIERIEAQERLLEGQIAYATVKLALTTHYEPPPTTAGSKIAKAAKDGIKTAWSFLVGIVVFIVAAGPTLLIIALIVVGIYYAIRPWLRRRRERKQAAAARMMPFIQGAFVPASAPASPVPIAPVAASPTEPVQEAEGDKR